jgi:hypothetical protein
VEITIYTENRIGALNQKLVGDIVDNVKVSQVPEVLQNDRVRCSSAMEHSAGEGGRISQSSPPASMPGRIYPLLILLAQNFSRKEYTVGYSDDDVFLENDRG